MKFHVVSQYPKNLDGLVVLIAEPAVLTPAAEKIDRTLIGWIRKELKALKFEGKMGDAVAVRCPDSKLARYLIIVGVGKPPFELDGPRRNAASMVAKCREYKLQKVAVEVAGKLPPPDAARAFVEGAKLADYHFNKYQKKEQPEQPDLDVHLANENSQTRQQIEKQVHRGAVESDAAILARDLVNEPPSELHPRKLAEQARRIAKTAGLKVEVKGPKEMAKLGLTATLAVSKGSDEPAQFIKLSYTPTKPKTVSSGAERKHIVLVGKGVTFDAGGINLKPGKGAMLESMKMDMAGAAAVIATMSALKKLGVKHRVTGYVAATENLLGGSAYKPGDVVRAYNGRTIEVANTDAEGRLTLADVLSYAADRDKPDALIDLATLTDTEISLGPDYAALFSPNDRLAKALESAGKVSGEPIWRLPLPDSYQEIVRGDVADLTNTGSGKGYSINGALFLKNFVGNTPWAHVDIGGPAWVDKDKGYLKKGGTGYGVRLLLAYLGQ